MVARTGLLLVASRLHRRSTQPAHPAIPPDQTEAIVKALGGSVGEHKAGTLVAARVAGAAALNQVQCALIQPIIWDTTRSSIPRYPCGDIA